MPADGIILLAIMNRNRGKFGLTCHLASPKFLKVKPMSISKESDLAGMKKASEAVAVTLNQMIGYARVGMTTRELDDYGASVLQEFGARSAPKLTYGFPGTTASA